MSAQERGPVWLFVSDGYQEMEFWYPLLRLREDGVAVEVVGCDGEYTYHSQLGYPVIPERALADAPIEQCSAVIVAGGTAAAAQNKEVADWVGRALKAGKTVGVTARSAGVLAAAGIASPGAPQDGVRAVADGRVVVAGSAEDLPAFYAQFASAAFH